MTIAALTNRPITIYGTGKQVRDLLYVEDLVRCYQAAVAHIDRVAEEVKRLGAKRAMVLSTPEQRREAEEVARGLGELSADVYAEAVMHVPIETACAAREEAKRRNADCYVAIGGGSTVGLGKAIALESGLPIVAVVDTNCDPDLIAYRIPGNDDAIRAIKLFSAAMADAVLEGKRIAEERQKGEQDMGANADEGRSPEPPSQSV